MAALLKVRSTDESDLHFSSFLKSSTWFFHGALIDRSDWIITCCFWANFHVCVLLRFVLMRKFSLRRCLATVQTFFWDGLDINESIKLLWRSIRKKLLLKFSPEKFHAIPLKSFIKIRQMLKRTDRTVQLELLNSGSTNKYYIHICRFLVHSTICNIQI